MQKAEPVNAHTKRVSSDLESAIRRIMFRRLLAFRAPKIDKNEEVKTDPIEEKNHINNSNNNEQEVIKQDKVSFEEVDNKLVIEEIEKREVLSNTNDAEQGQNEVENDEEINEKESEEIEIQSEEENEKKDDEKDSVEESESSTESFVESEEESKSDICKSESYSDAEGKDSGIEKGESPTLESKDSTDDEEDEEEGLTEQEPNTENIVTGSSTNIPDLRTSSFVGTATLNVLSPSTAKTKRLVKRAKSARRSRKDIDLDSEVSCDCSSPEKPSKRKNMTISYLSYPQRYVRSSLAVEARLSQWRKETSVLENARAARGDTPTRSGILKQTQQNTTKNSTLKGMMAPIKDVRFPSNRLYDSDTSSDEEMRMSVRKIYSSKSALRKRIENLEGMLLSMATQKCGLKELIVTMETWSLELSHVDRTKLGVPYIRSVKEVLKKQRRAITNKKSNFNRLVSRLQDANVPCFSEVNTLIKQLHKDISSIVQDRKRYSSRDTEDIRQTQGTIIGTCSAITAVFYEE